MLDGSYSVVDGLALGVLGTHQICQLVSAIDEVVCKRCEQLKETVSPAE